MGCLPGKIKGASAKSDDIPAEKPPYKTASQTLIDVKDFQFVQFDSRLPFSKRQIFSLLQSWKGIRRDLASAGVEMLVELIYMDSEVHSVFGRFGDIKSKNELRSSEKLECLALRVMDVLDDIVIHLDEYEHVVSLLNKVGVRHRQWLKHRPDLMKMIKQPFLHSVQLTLGDRYTDNMHSVYEIFIDFVIQELIKAIVNSKE